MVAIGARRPDVVAITAAMLHPVGLAPFRPAYPDRVFDVGIAEQHAMTMAAGLAMAGLHPVVAIYATFLNRAFDQLLMDVALHKLPVTVTLDRAGRHRPGRRAATTACGTARSCRSCPGLRIAAPRDGSRIAELLNEAVAVSDGPTVVRYPEGHRRRRGRGGRQARRDGRAGACPPSGAGQDVLLLGAGPMAVTCVEVARTGWPTTASASPSSTRAGSSRSTRPVVAAARQHRLVAVVEDNGRAGGFGDAVARLLRDHDVDVPVKTFGLPQEFLDHGVARRDPRGGRADPAAPGAAAHRGGRPPHPAAAAARTASRPRAGGPP